MAAMLGKAKASPTADLMALTTADLMALTTAAKTAASMVVSKVVRMAF